ncbi:MAG: type II secretion system F family protein, partial [Candidatus Omnitrophica bacterium]|nr:type II secretion system F family protein [Candidatus Omnitrophota bacterium]
MSVYKYRAKKGPEDIVEGVIDAQSEKEAVEKISLLGYLPIKIELQQKATSEFRPESKFLKIPVGRINSAQITLFSRQLASLLKSGVPILDSLNIISEQSENLHFRLVLHSIHSKVKDGATLSSSLALYPRLFSNLYIAMVRSGEDSGNLPEVLFRIADYRTKQEEMILRFRTALAYPILMALVGVGMIIFMLTFVMPRLMGIFAHIGQSLPLPTRILLTTSQVLRRSGLWILVILSGFILFIKRQL